MAKSLNLEVEVSQILETYNLEVVRATQEASKEAANETVKILKAISPTGKARRHYRTGWRVTRRAQGILTTFIVHNATKPGMTQLLEYGHVIRNQKGTYGRTNGIKHISKAEREGIEIFEDSLNSRL